jgi:hypothetical protein
VLLSVHAGVGALVGHRLPGPVAAALHGLGSHAALDAIWHDDNGGDDPRSADRRACAVDLGLALLGILALGLLGGWRSRALVGAVAGALPDLELALPWNRCRVEQARLLEESILARRAGTLGRRGNDVSDLTATVDAYLSAWNERDPAWRARPVAEAWAADESR